MQVDNLILTKSLGKGSFGEVFLTTKTDSNELYATKRLDRAFSEKPENMKRLTNEITILKRIYHPNIVQLIDLKKSKTHVYIVTEYCNGGSLTDRLNDYIRIHYKPFPEEIVQYLMRQIVEAIKFLHANKVIHRDLKLDNILVNFPTDQDKKSLNMMKATVKIIDFGFATRLRSSKANLTHTVLGTPTNMIPQLLENLENQTRNKEGYDEKADIWSLGTICYELLTGHMTFSGRNMNELYQKVKEGNYSLPLTSSKEAVSFINGMLQYDPKKRLSAEELSKHDFLVKKVRDFTKIDKNEIANKISGNKIKINIKDSKNVWAASKQNNKNNNNNINNKNINNKYNNETINNYANNINQKNINNNYNKNLNYYNNINYNNNQNVEIPSEPQQQQNQISRHSQKENKNNYAKVTRMPNQVINQYHTTPENIYYGQPQMLPYAQMSGGSQDIYQDSFSNNQIAPPPPNINQIFYDNYIK